MTILGGFVVGANVAVTKLVPSAEQAADKPGRLF